MTMEILAMLEKAGFSRFMNGGNTHVWRKKFAVGEIVASGFDGDEPQENWFTVAVYANFDDGESQPLSVIDDSSAEPEFSHSGPVDFGAALVETLAKFDKAEALALAFALEVQKELTPAEWDAMRRRNVNRLRGTCATHDFRDSNELMEAAYLQLFGSMWSASGQMKPEAVELWNKAWEQATPAYLTE